MSTYEKPETRIVSCGDVSCEFLVDPIPRPRPAPFSVTAVPSQRRVVLVDSNKPNSIAILRRSQELMRERGIEVEEEIRVKANASYPLDDATLDELAREGGLILCGVSD